MIAESLVYDLVIFIFLILWCNIDPFHCPYRVVGPLPQRKEVPTMTLLIVCGVADTHAMNVGNWRGVR